MKTPPLLLGAALLFWGWQTELLILAAIMALVIEGSRLVKSRLDLSHSDFRRISNLCTFLFMGMVIYLLATNRSPGAILILIQRFPIIFFPLLREAGMPARYATGYSVKEFSRMENRFIVRSRHAHAWVLAYMDDAWHNVDTTPSSWINIEEKAASSLEPLYDLWSWCFFKFSQWRWRERGEGSMTKHVWWLLIPLTLVLLRRFYSRSRVRRVEKEPEKKDLIELQPGADSAFYLVEQRLIESGYTRHAWETLSDWITRIEKTPSSLVSTEQLPSILALHYRYRFDPMGITGDDKEALTSQVHSWLQRNGVSPSLSTSHQFR